MSSLDNFKNSFHKFREKKYALPLGLLLTFIVCAVLLLYSYALCFGYLAIAVIGYYVPYFFGMKDRRKLAVWGLVLLIAIAVPFGANTVLSFQSYENDTVKSSNGVLFDGQVAPFSDVENGNHNFTVTVTDPSISSVSLLINDWLINSDLNAPNQNITMDQYVMVGSDRQFYREVQLPDDTVYAFHFGADNGTAWITTEAAIGPINMPIGTLYANAITGAIVSTLMSVGILFYLLLVLNWWTDRTKKKAAEMQRDQGAGGRYPPMSQKDKQEKFICSECRAEVPADAKACPQCGEMFEDEEPALPANRDAEDEYFCTECGATVKESDTRCPNCGKEFED